MTDEERTLERRPRHEIVESQLDVEQYTRSLSSQIRESARTADVLLVPTEFGEEHPGGYFPEATPAVLQHLQTHLPQGLTVEAAVDDDEYAEYAYRSIDIILPAIVILGQQVLSGILIAILADYVRLQVAKWSSRAGYVNAEVHARSPDGRGFEVRYEGPPDTFESVMTRMLESVMDGDDRLLSDKGSDC